MLCRYVSDILASVNLSSHKLFPPVHSGIVRAPFSPRRNPGDADIIYCNFRLNSRERLHTPVILSTMKFGGMAGNDAGRPTNLVGQFDLRTVSTEQERTRCDIESEDNPTSRYVLLILLFFRCLIHIAIPFTCTYNII